MAKPSASPVTRFSANTETSIHIVSSRITNSEDRLHSTPRTTGRAAAVSDPKISRSRKTEIGTAINSALTSPSFETSVASLRISA